MILEKKYAKAAIAIIVVFAIGLVGFYAFSAMYGDGLEKTMEDNGVEEAEQQYTAPLTYGEVYGDSLIMGIIGFAIVFVVFLGFWFIAKNRKAKNSGQ